MPARKSLAESPAESGPSETKARGNKEKESFGCPYPGCGQSYSRMEYLKRHQRKHQDVRPFQCKDCAKSFARSDVLLRHRRRCHPTPPPPDRSSRSPVPMHRGYPGVPVSSSRNDAPEVLNSYRGRKHGRSSDDDQQAKSRRRVEEEGDEEDENNQFRQNGMGNGGVYGMGNLYGDTGESSSYTPHLLPMFQGNPFGQTSDYHSQDDPNHLEDASVLLSMAYGGPSNDNHLGSQDHLPMHDEWGTGQTINMMMDASVENGDGRQRNLSAASGEDAQIPAASFSNENLGNFLGAMNWLGMSSKDGQVPNEGANTWNSAIIDPSLTNNTSSFMPMYPTMHAGGNGTSADGNADSNSEANQAIMSILNQLAMHEVPQTKANPNPERPLLRLAHQEMVRRAGPEADVNSRFYLPADRFVGCYQIPHWALPPLQTLSLMANRTFDTVLNHFSFVHTPTFRLGDTAACLAFAICTIGGIKTERTSWDRLLNNSNLTATFKANGNPLDGPVPPGEGWDAMYRNNYSPRTGTGDDEDVKKAGQWTGGQIVRNEKTNMLVKSFSQAQGVLMTEYNVALLQALILYHAPYFLSEEQQERFMANMFLGTIVNITRQIGFLNRELDHFVTTIDLPPSIENYTVNELDLHWRKWIQLETRRRTAFIVYHLDTISAIEGNIPCIMQSCEMGYLPLPAPDSLWKAETAENWLKAIRKYRPITLDEAMRRVFFLPTFGAFDTIHEQADTKYYCLLNEMELGPFARSAMMITLLRGIMDVGEGKRDRGDWRDLTDLWVSCSWLRPGKKMLDSEGKDIGEVTAHSLRCRFTLGLQRWREGWDFDPSCPRPAMSTGSTTGSSTSPQSNASSSDSADRKLNYCEEALPYYWMAQGLLGILNSAPPSEPGWNVFASGSNGQPAVKYGDLLKSARTFTRLGEGVVNLNTGSTSDNTPTDVSNLMTDFGSSISSVNGLDFASQFSTPSTGTTGLEGLLGVNDGVLTDPQNVSFEDYLLGNGLSADIMAV